MKISEQALDVLGNSKVEGNLLFLPDYQLDRNVYQDVNKVLELMGGKWNRSKKAHIFEVSPEDAIDMALETGELTNTKKEFQFFETPADLATYMICLAEPQLYETVLEPSAGRGAIAKLLKQFRVDCIELEPGNRMFLRNNGYNVVGEDFLFFNERYDVIIANPPFAKQQDIDHIHHMLDLANRCVVAVASGSVLFRTNKKTMEFRERIYRLGGTIQALPQDSFKESGTHVNTCLVFVDNLNKK